MLERGRYYNVKSLRSTSIFLRKKKVRRTSCCCNCLVKIVHFVIIISVLPFLRSQIKNPRQKIFIVPTYDATVCWSVRTDVTFHWNSRRACELKMLVMIIDMSFRKWAEINSYALNCTAGVLFTVIHICHEKTHQINAIFRLERTHCPVSWATLLLHSTRTVAKQRLEGTWRLTYHAIDIILSRIFLCVNCLFYMHFLWLMIWRYLSR